MVGKLVASPWWQGKERRMYAPGKSDAVSRYRRGGLVYGGMEVEGNGSGCELTGMKKGFRRQGNRRSWVVSAWK